VVLTDVFKFEQTSVTTEGKVLSDLKPTGIRPLFSQRLEAAGFKLGTEIFGANMSAMLGRGNRR
jgi:pilus assembly protein CpaF